MGAFAKILKEVAVRAQHLKQPVVIPVEPMLVKKMLRFFRKKIKADKSVNVNGEERYGWSLDYISPPRPIHPVATAIASRLLALINEMLDEQINALVLPHFSVKRPEELKERGLDLHTLFYPDYGLRRSASPFDQKESVAILLQKMCAHVTGLQDRDTLCSLVLHGPQGTGKTTIAEALASSCGVPLLEVTPSDIVVRGEEAVERRARVVFEALSLLTRVVILFDEFDPVLRRRDPSDDRPSNVFAFLTPGMLPKLKTLHSAAKRRSVAYMLITNLIGGLDEAAVREGRFDKRMGIYPPDLLSRCGRFLSEAIALTENLPTDEDSKARLQKVMQISAGAGMQALTHEGNFRCPEDHKKRPEKGTLLYYYIYHTLTTNPEPAPLGRDADFHWGKINGTGSDVKLEYQQWGWIESWDKNFKEKAEKGDPEALLKALRDPPNKGPDVPLNLASNRDLFIHLLAKGIGHAIVEAESRGVPEPKLFP